MIYAQPSATVDSFADQAPPGLVGVIGWQLLDAAGGVVMARTTAGIQEIALGATSVYRHQFTAPADGGAYLIVWDDGGGVSWDEGLDVSPVAPTRVLGPLYTSPTDVRRVLAPGGDQSDQSTAASLDDADLWDAIGEAQAEVDAALRGPAYDPAEVPPAVSNVTRDIAAYLATLVHRKGTPVENAEPVARRYARAEQLLENMAKGQTDLPGEGQSATAKVRNPVEGGTMFPASGFGIRTTGGLDTPAADPGAGPPGWWRP